MPRPSLLALLLLPVAPVLAPSIDAPAPLVVMNLAAHPDDEDGLTLAYDRWARDAVAYSVIFTRGEGGQNEIGPDLYERLGLRPPPGGVPPVLAPRLRRDRFC